MYSWMIFLLAMMFFFLQHPSNCLPGALADEWSERSHSTPPHRPPLRPLDLFSLFHIFGIEKRFRAEQLFVQGVKLPFCFQKNGFTSAKFWNFLKPIKPMLTNFPFQYYRTNISVPKFFSKHFWVAEKSQTIFEVKGEAGPDGAAPEAKKEAKKMFLPHFFFRKAMSCAFWGLGCGSFFFFKYIFCDDPTVWCFPGLKQLGWPDTSPPGGGSPGLWGLAADRGTTGRGGAEGFWGQNQRVFGRWLGAYFWQGGSTTLFLCLFIFIFQHVHLVPNSWVF